MKSRFFALVMVFASLYIAIGYALHSISFLQIQVRVADALYPLIAVFGLPSLCGLTLGHFMLNLSSPLGLIDLLSVAMFLPAKFAILKFGLKAVPLHVLSVGLWVAYMLWHMFRLPYLLTFVLVFTGEFIAEIVLGIPLAVGIKRRLLQK